MISGSEEEIGLGDTLRMTERLLSDATVSQESTKKRQMFLSMFNTAVSNISVQYNFQAISIALIVMSQDECTLNADECKSGIQAAWIHSTATATVFAGCIAGQLTLGYAGDVFGRNIALTSTLLLASISALLSAVAPTGDATSVYLAVILCRFALGVGLGGVYPLSATKAAEDAASGKGKPDSKAASRAFFWQSPGAMLPWILAMILTYGDIGPERYRWRWILGIGCIPSALVVVCSIYERQLKMQSRVDTAVTREPKSDLIGFGAKPKSVIEHLSDRNTLRQLAATGGGWFLYDVCYYGVNLFGGEIVSSIYPSEDDNISSNESIRSITQRELIALSMGIPAALLTIYLLNFYSTKFLQVYGFLLIAGCFFLLAGLFDTLRSQPEILYALYCLLLFSLSFGPNVTTFILPSETFPAEIRSTFNGISAACGKLGAVVGAYMFGIVAGVTSYVVVMIICGILAILGAIVSQLLIGSESSGILGEECKSLNDSSEHDEENDYLVK